MPLTFDCFSSISAHNSGDIGFSSYSIFSRTFIVYVLSITFLRFFDWIDILTHLQLDGS